MPKLSREHVFAGTCQTNESLADNPLEKGQCGVSGCAGSQAKG